MVNLKKNIRKEWKFCLAPPTHWDLWMFLNGKGESVTEWDGRHIKAQTPTAKELQA